MQKVEIYIGIAGDYCAFHEMTFSVEYDVTNNKLINKYSDMSIEEYQNWDDTEYQDYKLVDALLINGNYFVDFNGI